MFNQLLPGKNVSAINNYLTDRGPSQITSTLVTREGKRGRPVNGKHLGNHRAACSEMFYFCGRYIVRKFDCLLLPLAQPSVEDW